MPPVAHDKEGGQSSSLKTASKDSKQPVRTRSRANSSSEGSSSSGLTSDLMTPNATPRNKYTHITILKSLNNTFETKILVVPFKPDGLKLGRPIANSTLPQGAKQDLQSQVRPDNGNFDSRVLSRNHASLSCEPFSGKIYIRDLKSSNGTFVNGARITQNDVELQVGDIIDLGTDIDAKFEHRKISALVEDISVIPLIHDDDVFFSGIDNTKGTSSNGSSFANNKFVAPNAQRAAFAAAMFGDVNNLDLEGSLLGSETEILSGIFINNSIGTSPNLINVIKTLVTEISLERHEYEKMKSIERFLVQFSTSLEHINKLRVENNDMQLVQLQNALKQKLNDKHDASIQVHVERLNKIERENANLRNQLEETEKHESDEITGLKREIEDLNTRLEVEKFKNAQLRKSNEEIRNSTRRSREGQTLNKADSISEDTGIKKNRSTILLSAFTIGIVAAAFQYSSKK
ncbi:LAME_0E03422g1_1 [Lachancea meyersii CBS 8951]|uniref:LAME_0E03422g1_1 n=1 Tax=Lachancea meyersii CBS 8951 TaxID=1266667 RepID=A0A1G4JGQ0_9SACH|nr:LAME_0E03422g1_1 [Lachancea meyersii CBS 8951]